MTLGKKIVFGFLISSFIIMLLSVSAYVNFVEIRKEIRYLELSDTLRSKTLQLRRHEKNFLLYGDREELENVHIYINEISGILKPAIPAYENGTLSELDRKLAAYSAKFDAIEAAYGNFGAEFGKLKASNARHSAFFPLIESTVLERPLVNAELIEKEFHVPEGNGAVRELRSLGADILALRKDGEEILLLSKDLDKSARAKVEQTIRFGEVSLFVLFPLFFFVGLGILFAVSKNVVRRLNVLAEAIGRAGKGEFFTLKVPEGGDEVSLLMDAFNKMENDLVQRDAEIRRKNEEIHRSRKLASLGTLAAGVAHEINNPLNNIYLAAQTLKRETSPAGPEIVREAVEDIFSQTLRVKRIVSELLIFAREKPPELQRVNVGTLIRAVLGNMAASGELSGIEVETDMPGDLEILADRYLLEQVFINLFGNASDAMRGRGSLAVVAGPLDGSVRIMVSDTGEGIPPENIPRIFDPFFTTKEKGTGLGLAIVHGIIEKHRGRIEVESVPGKGTGFRIILPRKP